jgi:hypothetical protein
LVPFKPPLERAIQGSICDYPAIRKQSLIAPIAPFPRVPKYAIPGVSDITVVHVGRPYFLEVKRVGAYLSAEQKSFQTRAETAGAMYAVFRSSVNVQRLGL